VPHLGRARPDREKQVRYGTLPQVTGGAMPMLDLNSFKNGKQ
jgi:hypothetical protein